MPLLGSVNRIQSHKLEHKFGEGTASGIYFSCRLNYVQSTTPLKLHLDFQIPEGLDAGWMTTSGCLGLET